MKYDPQNFFHIIGIKFVDFYTRHKTPPAIFFRTGIALMIIATGGWSIIVQIYDLKFFASDAPQLLAYCAFFFGMVLAIIGGALWLCDYLKSTNRKKTIIIEQYGLKFSPEKSLKDSITIASGFTDHISCDVRERMSNGIIINPQEALKRVTSIPLELESKLNNQNGKDLEIIYGGLMAIPFTFLTGMLLDDENDLITIYDWDRFEKRWRTLDAQDNEERFDVEGLEKITNADEIILAVSASYQVDFEAITRTLGKMQMVHLSLPEGGPSCHWSNTKQQKLCESFSETLFKIKSCGIKKIHLFIAAPNSLCFNLGRNYDTRNFPVAQVYQYEQSDEPPYPWSLELPTHGKEARIVETKANS